MLAILLVLAAPVHLVPTASSRLWIDGDSNVRPWSCAAQSFAAEGRAQTGDRPAVERVAVSVPVQDLRCGDSHMDEKLRESLKASEFPRIEYVLGSVEPLGAEAQGERRVKATGSLSIAGRKRTVTMVVRAAAMPDGTLRAAGSVPLQMTDFGVAPPSALLGVVKSKDRIVVRFELFARAVFPVN